MKLKKAVVAGAAAALFVGSVMNVSAAKMTSGDYVDALKKEGKEKLIIDVEAYRAAYSDLDAAFGDDLDAYIEHYLTTGVYEGRTKGVLFDPLTYAAAYGDVREAYGDNIFSIVDHYVTFGVEENRRAGTANGYEDIETAKRSGTIRTMARRAAAPAAAGEQADASAVDTSDGSIPSGIFDSELNYQESSSGSSAAGGNNSSSYVAAGGSNSSNYAAAGSGSNYVAAGSSGNAAGTNDVGYGNGDSYRHTTSHYADDGSTLIRVEYYDDDNHLYEYSKVEDHDSSTNSYTENVYRYDDENKEEVLQRTDTYVNGELVSSEKSGN